MENEKNIRELGGEFWAEACYHLPEASKQEWELVIQLIDVMMGVLARHAGSRIANDEGLPVVPLPRTYPLEVD